MGQFFQYLQRDKTQTACVISQNFILWEAYANKNEIWVKRKECVICLLLLCCVNIISIYQLFLTTVQLFLKLLHLVYDTFCGVDNFYLYITYFHFYYVSAVERYASIEYSISCSLIVPEMSFIFLRPSKRVRMKNC